MKNKKEITNQYINVLDIKNDILYTKNGYIFKYIKLEPINIGTKSKEDIKSLIRNLSSAFSTNKENEPISFFKINKSININSLITDYRELYESTENLIRRKLLRLSSSYLHKYATGNIETQNEYYMVVFLKYKNNEKELEEKINTYIEKFKGAGINTNILNTEDIVRLCSIFVNPTIANNESMHLEEGLSILDGGIYEE